MIRRIEELKRKKAHFPSVPAGRRARHGPVEEPNYLCFESTAEPKCAVLVVHAYLLLPAQSEESENVVGQSLLRQKC